MPAGATSGSVLVCGLALACLTPALARADDAAALVQQARAAEARYDTTTALGLFLRADAARPNDPVILQKISRQYSDATNDTADVDEKKRLCTLALDYARRATALAPDDPVNQLSVAICYGKLGFYSDARTKVEYSRLVKSHAERALALDPNYDYAHHVLGRWHYEVATLGLGARFIVRLVYGGLPPASTAEAVQHLRRATELAPRLPSHRIELGLALLADGQRAAAKQTLEEALRLSPVEKHDPAAFERGREALRRLGES
ncbi:MAG TPA: hypothetical protein PLU52_11230 [Opitutaceae bacterium]|nr:hypothetical protein [Opitutaceae bacterium]HND62510.1 hypothetical protein [Opitutaceae bacterium]